MTNTAGGRNVVPSEVGWQFVPQYYTFVNKQPERLHLFYTKKSTFIHGVEGEDGKPCHGQQEIHQKIASLGYHDCKVFIHSVDAQSSADGGIIIQVIGEMSNHNEEWRKFVQTFFLAEQPNGYFVLNDIFRFLKEETVEGDEGREDEPVQVSTAPVPEQPQQQREPTPPPPAPLYQPVVKPATPTPPVIQEEPPTTVTDIPASPVPSPPSPRPNGVQHESEKPVQVAPVPAVSIDKARSPARSSTATPAAAPTPPPQQPPSQPAQRVATPQPPQPASVAPPPVTTAPTPAPAPAPAPAPTPAPAAPKTWANLAATNPKKWGSAVAQESRGTSEIVPVSSSSSTAPPVTTGTQTPPHSTVNLSRQQQQQSAGGGGGGGGGQVSHAVAAANALTTSQCFIKGVTEPISPAALSSTLTSRFGPIKEMDIVRSKACAFVEFISVDAARKAIISSLPAAQGGEGGIWVDLGDGSGGGNQQVRIVVETRKERGDRPAPRVRTDSQNTGRGGGGPSTGNSSGGGGSNFRGGRGGSGRGGNRGGGGK